MKRPVSKASERASKPSSSFTSTDRTTHTIVHFFHTIPTNVLTHSFSSFWLVFQRILCLYVRPCFQWGISKVFLPSGYTRCTVRCMLPAVLLVLYARKCTSYCTHAYLWSELFHRNLRFSPFQLCISRSPCDIVLKILWVSSISLLACLMY